MRYMRKLLDFRDQADDGKADGAADRHGVPDPVVLREALVVDGQPPDQADGVLGQQPVLASDVISRKLSTRVSRKVLSAGYEGVPRPILSAR